MQIVSNRLHSLDIRSTYVCSGMVTRVVGLALESTGPLAAIGELCHVHMPDGSRQPLEVIGFHDSRLLLMPLGELHGIRPGLLVTSESRPMRVPVGKGLLGRVVDAFCLPIDGLGPIASDTQQPLVAPPPDPLTRPRIKEILPLGVRVVDGLITCGRGQRIGIFGGSGVGKSTLLGMFAKHARSDVNVIALIGERGREVRDFIERDLGPEGMRRSVVLVATSDQPPLLRLKGAQAASAVAEYFRDQGLNVLLMMDSVTRACLAQREIGLAAGEPPTTRGYTPSVFSMLPKLLERSGTSEKGSITGLYTVFVEGDDHNEPVADAARAILDGHISLSRDLAGANHFPAIDVLQSQSRIFLDIASKEHRLAATFIRTILATYKEARDLIDVGAYVRGSNPEIDRALQMWSRVQDFLKQAPDETQGFAELQKLMSQLAGQN
ncbi:MAG: FliI/YscN family ATPase [Planctomycetota bacterium]